MPFLIFKRYISFFNRRYELVQVKMFNCILINFTLLSILSQMSDGDDNTEEVQAAAEDFMDLDEKIWDSAK